MLKYYELLLCNYLERDKMPNGDCTGPNGKGPATGRGLGRRAGNKSGRSLNKAPRFRRRAK